MQTQACIRRRFPGVIANIVIDYFMPKLGSKDRDDNIKEAAFSGAYEICERFMGHDATIALPYAASGNHFLLVKKLCKNQPTSIDDALWHACWNGRWAMMDYLATHGATKCRCGKSLEYHRVEPPMGPGLQFNPRRPALLLADINARNARLANINARNARLASKLGNGKTCSIIAMTQKFLEENDGLSVSVQMKDAVLEGVISRPRGKK